MTSSRPSLTKLKECKMRGDFVLIGTPEELNFKTYGNEGKELAEWKFGYTRFKTFSETVIANLRAATGEVMVSGEVREVQGKGDYSDRVFSEWTVTTCRTLKAKANKPQTKQQPSQQQTTQEEDWPPF